MDDTLMSVQIIPKKPNGEEVFPYVDEAIQVIDDSGIDYMLNIIAKTE